MFRQTGERAVDKQERNILILMTGSRARGRNEHWEKERRSSMTTDNRGSPISLSLRLKSHEIIFDKISRYRRTKENIS